MTQTIIAPAPSMAQKQRAAAKDQFYPYIWLLLATVLSLFTFGSYLVPLAAWIAPILLLRFFRKTHWLVGCLGIALSTVLATWASIWQGLLPFSGSVLYGIIIGGALVSVLPFGADRLLAPRLRGFAATLVFPLAGTALEFLGMRGNPWGAFGAIGHSQYGNLALMQLVSLTGLWGISLLIAWGASTVNWAWERGFDRRQIGRGLALYASVLAAVLLFGEARLAMAPPAEGSGRLAGLTAVDSRQELPGLWELAKTDRQAFRARVAPLQERYFAQTVQQARAGAQLVLWPEAAAIVAAEDKTDFIERSRVLAQSEGIYLGLPLVTLTADAESHENQLLLIDPAGEIVLEHTKYGGNVFEGGRRGDGVLRTAETDLGTVSGAICWDMDFPAVIAQSGRNGTDIFLVPTGDWGAIKLVHAQMSVFRAVENGISVFRQADNGLSIAVDPYGRVLAQMDHFAAKEGDQRVLVAQVPTQGVGTLYGRIGDLFGWLSVGGFLGLAAWVVVRDRRRAKVVAGVD